MGTRPRIKVELNMRKSSIRGKLNMGKSSNEIRDFPTMFDDTGGTVINEIWTVTSKINVATSWMLTGWWPNNFKNQPVHSTL
jgi:hypothetical protein